MPDPKNVTADDTDSSAGGPPEAGGLPVEDVAPDVEVVQVSIDAAEPDGNGMENGAAAQDFNPNAAAPEPSD